MSGVDAIARLLLSRKLPATEANVRAIVAELAPNPRPLIVLGAAPVRLREVA